MSTAAIPPPTHPICFIDTETTGLHPEALAWEFAGIRVDPVGTVTEHHFFIDLDLDRADLKALKIGGFYDRHPSYAPQPVAGGLYHAFGIGEAAPRNTWSEVQTLHTRSLRSTSQAARYIEEVTRDAILAGSNPDYDARILDRLLRQHQMLPAWHYRTLDVITLAAGRLARSTKPEHRQLVDTLPWKSDQIAAALGVTATPEDRHTALGDARWTKRIYDAAVTR